MMLNIVYTIL